MRGNKTILVVAQVIDENGGIDDANTTLILHQSDADVQRFATALEKFGAEQTAAGLQAGVEKKDIKQHRHKKAH